LVAITQINSAPLWRLSDSFGGPSSVRKLYRNLIVKRFVTLKWHFRWFLVIFHFSPPKSELTAGLHRDEIGPWLGLVAANKEEAKTHVLRLALADRLR
jgi:hypothetical protein